jgi:hypothetical protein
MLNKNTLIGILLVKPTYNIELFRSENSRLGYSVRPLILMRGELPLLSQISKTLFLYGIVNNIVEKENKKRPRPILRISGIKNNDRLMNLIPEHLIKLQNHIHEHNVIVKMLIDKKHLTLVGIEKIMKIRGIINGTDYD